MKIVMSTGHGRLHLVTAAEWLAKAGVTIRLVCGWIPRNSNGWLVRLCSRVVGRDLSKGMAKRTITVSGIEICTMPLADFINQGMRQVDNRFFNGRFCDKVSSFGWKFFGSKSRKYLKGAEVFHCRSGAGQGGAIVKAKKLGLKVVVDHSIAHPAFMDRQLRAEYEKNKVKFSMGMDSLFWCQIVKDCEEADIVQVNSFFVRDTFLEQGFPKEKIKVVYLGVREDFVGLRSARFVNGANTKDPLRLLFTGGFGFRKGAEYILEALKLLKARGIEFSMNVVGDFTSARQLITKYENEFVISYSRMQQSVQTACPYSIGFHGPVPQDDLKSFLANSDIYVFPSLAEGCAQSGMEAMAAGLCVIGTRESGFPITDAENGFLIPSKNAIAIADKIEWLSNNRTVVDKIGACSAKLIGENYTWTKYAENTKAIYKELVNERTIDIYCNCEL